MAGNVVLSARMQAVADMVTSGNRVCDVGCDHGYVSIYLVQRGIAPKVLAMDIGEGPLSHAKAHVEQAGLSDYITLRLSDGLDAFCPGEAQSLICAGMGGRLMQKILEREKEKTDSFSELILAPQSEIAGFREFLRKMGYSVVSEDMILEEDKFYPIIKAVPEKGICGQNAVLAEEKKAQGEMTGRRQAQETFPEEKLALEDRFGPILLQNRHPVLLTYLKRELEKDIQIRKQLLKAQETEDPEKTQGRIGQRLLALERELSYIRQALQLYEE